jgi:hypothetical protein
MARIGPIAAGGRGIVEMTTQIAALERQVVILLSGSSPGSAMPQAPPWCENPSPVSARLSVAMRTT